MKIKIFSEKLVGYKTLKAIAEQKGFWDDVKREATIPKGYTVETDGILWSIRLDTQPDQG